MYAHKAIVAPNSCNDVTLSISSCLCSSVSLFTGAFLGAKFIASPHFSTMQKATLTIFALFVVPTAADLYTNDDVFIPGATDFNEAGFNEGELHYGVAGGGIETTDLL